MIVEWSTFPSRAPIYVFSCCSYAVAELVIRELPLHKNDIKRIVNAPKNIRSPTCSTMGLHVHVPIGICPATFRDKAREDPQVQIIKVL